GDRSLTFENCEFSNLIMSDDDSYAIAVGGVQSPQQQNNFSFINCLFSNNTSQAGIMLAASSNYPNINFTNCTFAGNESDTYTIMVNGNVNITNTIFENDTPYQIRVNPMAAMETTTLNIDYSSIKDGIMGIQQAAGNTINYAATNIDSDPLFLGGTDPTDPLYYSLSELSLCIDTGIPDISGLNLPPYDLVGNWRIWNGRIDMGCFEYGSEPWVSTDDPVVPELGQVALLQNYPNPFNPTTTISFSIPAGMQCSLDIYNLRGQKVKTLLNENMIAGKHSIIWNGEDDGGRKVSSGVYLYRLSTPNSCKTAKMLLMK
ncbi:MAG: FlgD immunoglobulin-like domain containing protein, partial [Actinomycetota bacterium]|nr:FlgD immunoglobulin-like domain containing protein [Actinomycetota bacterium]